MAVKEEDRIASDNYHLRIMAGALDTLNRNRDMLKQREIDFLDTLMNLQQIRVMPTLRQWNYMNSLKQTVSRG